MTRQRSQTLFQSFNFAAEWIVHAVRTQRNLWVHFGLAAAVLVGIDGISYVEFGHRDVVRHKLVQRIVEAYKEHTEERTR